MREIVPGESRLHPMELPEDTLRSMGELDAAIAARTQMVWGEHCSECAYPSCYASCSFYSPRPDLHCRRFDRGIEAVTVRGLHSAGTVGDAPLMRVRFSKWGKLVGHGAQLRTRELAERHEKARDAFGKIADLGLLPYGLRHVAGRAWTRLETRSRAGEDSTHADALVVECVSLGERDVPFTVTIHPKEQLRRGLFQERIVLGGGYCRHVIPTERIAGQIDLARPFLVHIEPLVESPPEVFLFGIVDFVRWSGNPVSALAQGRASSRGVTAPSVKGTPSTKAKCIVWDLDDTVWDGILAEVGIAGVKLRPHVVEVLRAFDGRGILHSIASKNDEAEAMAALRHFGIDELFLHPQIGWRPKSESVARLAKLLDIHIDTFAFVDDQLFERTEVEHALPGVTTFPHTGLEALLQHPLFDTPVTSEGSRRRVMYREEMTRNVVLEAMGSSDYDTFLRSCQIRLKLALLSDENATRVYDLSQRTNQLNVTGTRYDRREVDEMARSPGKKLPIVMHCEDRFGDYGIIGFVLLDPDEGLVVDYLMSCRVQRKCLENALFAHIQTIVEARGAKCVRCRYKRTARNQGALDLLQELGFRLHESSAGSGILERELGPIPGSDIVALAAEGVK